MQHCASVSIFLKQGMFSACVAFLFSPPTRVMIPQSAYRRSYPYENPRLWQEDLSTQRALRAKAAAANQQHNGAPGAVQLPTYTFEL